VSHFIHNGKYKNALIVSGDVASKVLNENERHSFELFGDGAVSAVVSRSDKSSILFSKQLTYSKGTHMTEIVDGSSTLTPFEYNEKNKHKFQFHMQGKDALIMTMGIVNEMMADIEKNSGFTLKDIDMIIPHQASSALGLIMRKLRVPKNKFINIVKEYGNMVSASVPFALDYAINNGKVRRGDIVLLLGSAAGLTVNTLIMRY
jgi:3-oxoacyl-[acyl-carrier-protein] synthase-3